MWVSDSEADGLLHEVTKMHCFVTKKFKKSIMKVYCRLEELTPEFVEETKNKYPYIEFVSINGFKTFLDDCDSLVIHNLFGYDLPMFKKLGYLDSYDMCPEHINGKPCRLLDSLSMSRCLYPDRPLPRGCPSKVYNPVTKKYQTVGSHGLHAWGLRVANLKPKVDDWRNQPLDVYVHRCIEDVIINELVLDALIKESQQAPEGGDWKVPLRINNKSDFLMEKQESDGILFDREGAINLTEKIDVWMEDIAKTVNAKLPRRPLPKSNIPNFPANPFKKGTGEVSMDGWKWLKNRLGYPIDMSVFELSSPPKTAFKKDGSLSAVGAKWCIKNGETDEDKMPDFIRSQRELVEKSKPLPDELMDKAIKDLRDKVMPDLTEPMTISNQQDIKKYLVEQLGWVPLHWRTKDVSRDDRKQPHPDPVIEEKVLEYIEDVKDSPYKEFIYDEMGIDFEKTSKDKLLKHLKKKARFLVTTPQFKDDRGEICSNLEKLDGEMAKQIVTWLSLRNRRSVLKALDEKKETGWLNEDRLDVDGRIGQGMSGPTNTNRYKHRRIVNLPKADPSVLLGYEMRSLFIAPRGKKILGYDGSNLEQFVAASYAYQYDKGAYAELIKGDAHTTNALAYSRAAGRTVSRGEGKGITYACLPVDSTEVLTPFGWKKYRELSVGDKVLSYNTEKGVNEWDAIQHIHFFEDSEVLRIENSHFSFEATGDHRWYGEQRRQKGKGKNSIRWQERKFFTTEEINSEKAILRVAPFVGGNSPVTKDEGAFLGWLLSDGYYSWSNKLRNKVMGITTVLIQDEKKYLQEILILLERLGYSYTVHNKTETCKHITVGSKHVRDLLFKVGAGTQPKHEVEWYKLILDWTPEALQAFLDAFWMADGYIDGKGHKLISQNEGNILECVKVVTYLLGMVPQVHDHGSSGVNGYRDQGLCRNVRLSPRTKVTGQRLTKTDVGQKDVFCLTLNNSTFVARQGDHITITGNCPYGAGAAKIGKMLGVSKDKGQDVIDAFWDTNFGLKAVKEYLEGYWERSGKKFICGIDGRKIYTRSKSSLVNALFQSCGSIIMFLSGLYMYDALKKEGLLDQGVVRLAFVHDEYQYEVPDELITPYYFETGFEDSSFVKKVIKTYDKELKNHREKKPFRNRKQIAEDFGITFEQLVNIVEQRDSCEGFEHPEGKLLSNSAIVDGKFVRYYSRVGELGDWSLSQAGKYFKLPLPFEAAYDIGQNLAETH